MKKDVLDGKLESIAMALTGRRLPYVYLIWKNPRFMINLNHKFVN